MLPLEKLGYMIEGYCPYPQGFGQSGFSISLAPELAGKFKLLKRNDDAPLKSMLLDYMKKSVAEYDRALCRIEFLDDSWLIRSMAVGGQCACFGIDGMSIDLIRRGDYGSSVSYNPHNIDNPQQASAILGTWLLWFNHVIFVD